MNAAGVLARGRIARDGIRPYLDDHRENAAELAERDRDRRATWQGLETRNNHEAIDACRAARFYDLRGWPRSALPLDARRYANHLAGERRARVHACYERATSRVPFGQGLPRLVVAGRTRIRAPSCLLGLGLFD